MHALELAGPMLFLSTLSLRRATARPTANTGATKFLSTLSLRRATNSSVNTADQEANFYPRSPCGERPPVRDIIQWEGIFLSTLSLRRATSANCSCRNVRPISIHALLAESDVTLI